MKRSPHIANMPDQGYSTRLRKTQAGGHDMKGSIYVSHKCECGGRFQYFEHENGCFCKTCGAMATKGWYVSYGKEIQKRFAHDFKGAQRFLNLLRYKADEKSLDPRDYKASAPLGFENLARQWLEFKKKQVKRGSYVTYSGYIQRGIDEWGNRNIKDIGDGDIEDFLYSGLRNRHGDPVSSKTLHEIKSVFVQFWRWVVRRNKRFVEMPEFPKIGFEMGYRDVVDLDTQTQIIDKVKEISWHINPKIWWGIKILSENPNVRPGELRNIKEGDINLEMGLIQVRKTKERSKKRGKYIQLEEEDVRLLRTLPTALPTIPFFRHSKGTLGIVAGSQFGVSYFNKWWKRACKEIGVVGVTLYAGTKHSTVTAASEILTPEEIRRGGSEHSTNSAFNRYLVPNSRDKLKFRTALKQLKGGVVKIRKDGTG